MALHFMVADIIDKRDSWRWLKPWWHAASDGYKQWWNHELLQLDEVLQHILPMAQNLSWVCRSLRNQVQSCLPNASIQRLITLTDSKGLAKFALQHVMFGLLSQDWMCLLGSNRNADGSLIAARLVESTDV